MLFGEFDQGGARRHIPLAPRRDDLDVRFERVIGEFEPDLIIALAGRAVADGVGADLARDFDLPLGNQRPRDGRAKQIEPFILGVGAEHRKDIVAHEFFAQILDKDIFGLDAEQLRFLAGRLQFFALAEICRESDDFAAIGRSAAI